MRLANSKDSVVGCGGRCIVPTGRATVMSRAAIMRAISWRCYPRDNSPNSSHRAGPRPDAFQMKNRYNHELCQSSAVYLFKSLLHSINYTLTAALRRRRAVRFCRTAVTFHYNLCSDWKLMGTDSIAVFLRLWINHETLWGPTLLPVSLRQLNNLTRIL